MAMGDLSETPSLLSDSAFLADDVWNTWHDDGNSQDSSPLAPSTAAAAQQHSYNEPSPLFSQNPNTRHPTTIPPEALNVVADPPHPALSTRNESNESLQSIPDEIDFPSPSTPSVVSWNILSSDSESDISPMNSQRLRQGRPLATPTHHTDNSQQTSGSFVDLTEDTHTPLRSRLPSARNPHQSNKRRRVHSNSSAPSPRGSQRPKVDSRHDVPPAVEEVDLRFVEDDKGLSRVLEDQRMATIKAQQEQASKPVKLATLSCVICMELMTDVTATYCGHLFCHKCLMEALIAGENQGSEPGKGPSKCPVCRKKIKRPGTSKRDLGQVVTLEIKVRKRNDKGKGKESRDWTRTGGRGHSEEDILF